MGTSVRGLGLCLVLVVACGGQQLTTRVVDSPQGTTEAYGAPRNVTYSVEAEPELDVLRLHVYRAARCDLIPTDIVARRTETLDGDRVISSVEQGPVQIAKGATAEVPCDQGYARDVDVSLVVGSAVHALGTTDSRGYVGVNLSAELREKLFGVSAPAEAIVRVRGPKAAPAVDAGRISLASLREFEAATARMLDELSALLSKGGELSSPDIGRTYELYEKLRALAWSDPRFKAVSARFWELFFARKQAETSENLRRDLKVLESARALLKDAGDAAVPLFMQVALSSQSFDPRALDWSSGELLSALRSRPQLCSSFDWTKLDTYGFPLSTRIAVHYLRYAQGDDFYGPISGRCSFITRG